MDSSQRRLLVDIVSVSNRLTRIAAQASGNATPASQWRILSVLEGEGAQRVGELAAALRISQPAITQYVPLLEEQRLVRRETDPHDARAIVLTITPEGSQALADWKSELGGALSPLFVDLDSDDWATLERALAILTEATTSTTTPSTTAASA